MNELATTETSNIAIKLNSASQALAQATSDFERIEIRDAARKLQAAAEILNRRDIQVRAAILIMTAERDVTKANPPEVGGRGNKGVPLQDGFVVPSTLRNMRQAHDNLSDAEFDEFTQESIETDEPLTRSKLQKIVKDKKKKLENEEKKKQK